MKLIAIIPHYNHIHSVGQVAEACIQAGMDVLIVDDGSTPNCHTQLKNLEKNQHISILFRTTNSGKGAAVKDGLRAAANMQYTHALQIDADGQHNAADIPRFINAALTHPNATICAKPVYGEDAPKSRLYGRKITDFWNTVHVGKGIIRDGMCGFRLYPIHAVTEILNNEHLGNRMDFDIEILVRLAWRDVPLIWLDTPVCYGSASHFRMGRDNLMIAGVHTRLFFEKLFRLMKVR